MTPAPDRPVIAPADAPASPTAALAALATYRHLRAGTDALTDPTPAEEAVLLRTAREAARLGARAGLTEQAAEVIKTTTAHLRSPAAQGWRERGAKHYGKMILLAVRMNRHADALDLYARAGRFLKLDPSLRRGLAEAAVGLGRTDLGAARLYADALADGPTSPEMRALLRPALRIDLTTPPAAALAEIEALNETVRLADASAWASAHLAVAALRRGRAADARRLRDEARAAAALDRTTDVDTAARLGLVSYLCRDWQAAEELYRTAAAPFYLPLARAGRLLNDPKAADDADAFRRDLAAAAAELGRGAGFQPGGTTGRLEAGPTPTRDTAAELGRGAGFQPAGTTGRLETGPTPEYAAETTRSADEPGPALDAVRVRGAALAVLGQDAEAAAVFATAPVEYLTWRTVRPEAEVLARLAAPISPRLAEQAPALGQLLDATAALDRLDLPALRAAVAGLGGPAAEQPWFDADPPAVAACLRGELALTDPRPLASLPEVPADVSAGVRAWAARLAARWHLERGETGEARRLLADPVHWIAPAEARQLDAVVRDVSGDDAGAALEVAAKAPAAPAPHALAFGLWLCGRGRYADARAVFEPLPVELRESVEVRLALARGELADDPERARERLRGFLDGDEPARAVWVNAPRLALNRPWHQRVPIALWSLPADVSLHRVGDVLEAVELFLAAGQPEPAARTLALAEELLGKLLPDLAPQVGDGYRRLALADLARNDIEGACRRHDRAADLRAGDPEFPAKLAAALAEAPAAPDVALRVLCEAAADFRGTTAALDATELAATVRRVLAIEAATPADPAELDRRRRWTRTLAEKRADWDWPKRNLARDAARGGKPDEVLAHVAGIAAPEGADHLLSGHAAWALRRFAGAAGAFDRAIEAGAGLPDARAWRGVARAAERFATDTPTALASEEADALLADLDPAACTAELAPTARTWSGAVAVAAGRAEVALAALDPTQTAPDDAVPVGVLRGVGFALAGRDAEALAEWGDDATASPWGVALRALSLARRRDPADARAAALALRRAGADARLVALAEAQVKLGEGARPEPVVGLGAKDCPPLLLALRPLLDAEREFVAARRLQHEGRFADAAAALDAVAPRRLWPAAARVWRAACLAEAGNAADARVAFEALTSAPDVAADAHANLALLAVRGGDPDAAEQSAANAAAHPLARLARGEIADARGRADVARTTFAELADDAAADPVGRVRAAAALAAGRLAQNAGQPDQAERRYRQALALRPGWPAAAERLGLLLAVSADDEERLEEAAALFPTGDGTDATVVLAQAVVGERLGRVDLVAERLDHLIRLPGFDRLPPDLRHGVAKWSAGVRLRRGDYRAAAAALERVWREEPTAAVEDQLVRCRLLQADGAVKQLPIPDGAIEEAAAAAEDVLARRPGDRLALLIATACGLLLKHENTRAAALGAVEWATDGERLAAAALRLLSGEGGATADIDRYAAAGPAGAARTLALLSASLAKNPEPFADAAAQLADAPDADGLPFEPEDVMLVGALDRVGRDQHDKAAKWLNRWHAAPGRGTAGSKQLHAFLLGREAGQILKTDLNGAADLLTRAIKLLPQAGRGT